MIRMLLLVAAGVVLGGIVHIAVVLTLPALAEENLWTRASALGATSGLVVLDQVQPGEPNPLQLDPELAYATCALDLVHGPGIVRGRLPLAFWSLAVYRPNGTVLYSTTNRDGLGTRLEVGLFNPTQTRLLAQEALGATEGLLIVEADVDELLVLVRLAPPYQAMRARYEEALGGLVCGNLRIE